MIVIPKRKALVLKVREPDRILNVIPTAKLLEFKGERFVAVPHKLDETRVLRNLGFSAPSPIRYYYPWPRGGQFDPFDAQLGTAEFLTLSGNAFVLNELGCVDAETEYLSPTGWRRIADYSGGAVAQYWPETGTVDFVDAPEYVKLPCREMLRVKTKYGVDQMVSPEHRVLLHAYNNPLKREVVPAHELFLRHQAWVRGEKSQKSTARIGYTEAAIPVSFAVAGGAGLDMTDAQLRVQVAVIADGYVPGPTTRCIVRLKRQRKKERLQQLLRAAGIPFTAREQDTPTARGFTVFTFNAPTMDKEFHAGYWAASARQLMVITDEVIHWDGSFRVGKPTREFSSRSKLSADFVQYAFAATGYTARLTTYERGTGTDYTVIIRDNGRPLKLAGMNGNGRLTCISPAQSPDGYKYCFMVPSTFLVLRRNGCIFCTGNTGKTLSALWAYDYLRGLETLNKALIIAPLSTLERTWADEIFQNFPHLNAHVLHGTREKRLKLLEQDVNIYIINHDGIKTAGFTEALAQRPDIDLVIVDEVAQVARNSGADRWKALNRICNKQSPRRVWGMTGTPTPNAPTDAWAQCKLITPATVPPYFNRFKDMVMRQVGQFAWIPRPNAMEVVYDAMQPAVRYTRDECIDLPPCLYQTRSVELTTEQKKAYKEMANRLQTEMEEGEVLAVNEAVKAAKLVQIACGIAYGTNGEHVAFPCENRMAVVHEIVKEAGSKVIVFVPYVASVNALADYLKAKGVSVEVVYGQISKNERDRIFRAFQKLDDPKVIVAQPAAMSHGLTLTAASTIVWYAPPTSNETYFQANGRITRPGQTQTQFIINLEGTPIERKMYERLKNRSDMQGILLDLVKQSVVLS